MRGKGSGRVFGAVAVVAGLMTAVAFVARRLDAHAGVSLADFTAVALTAVTLIPVVWSWYRRGSAPESGLDVEDAARTFAAAVREQWRTEMRVRAVHSPEPIPVMWQLSSNTAVMSKPHLISDDPDFVFAGNSADIEGVARRFRALRRRRLVIMGGAGTGKTTLAVQLMSQLLDSRETDMSGSAGEPVPVPVLLPVSGWDTTVYPRLQDWLVVRLAQDYPALASRGHKSTLAETLVARGYILPVLDGLDEVPQNHRADVIKALNHSLGADDQLILTSRTTEFAAAVPQAGQPVHGAAVITPRMLTPLTAAAYLESCLPAKPSATWRAVLDAVTAGRAPGLAKIVSTPLGLWLVRTVYISTGADASPLIGPLGEDYAALRSHLFDELIPALVQTRPPSVDAADHFRPRRRWDPVATRRYLSNLARIFPPDSTRDLAWWHIARTVHGFRSAVGILVVARLGPGRWPYAVGVATLIGMAVGLVLGTLLALTVVLPPLRPGSGMVPDRTARSTTYGRRLALRVAAGVSVGLAVRMLVGLVTGSTGWVLATVLGLVAGAVVVVASTGRWEYEAPGYADLRLRRGAALLTIGRGLARWLFNGLRIGLVFEAVRLWFGIKTDTGGEPPSMILIGLVAGLAAGSVMEVVKWAETPALTSITTPRLSLRADRTLTLLRMLILGLMVAVLSGGFFWGLLATTSGMDRTLGTAVFVAIGLAFGAVLGLTIGKHHAWLTFTIAAGVLALRRELPWRLMDFMEDAHRLGLLRAVGPLYQFRHANLHDHLSAGPGAAPVARRTVAGVYARVPDAE
ncbi:NACHT domain-containing protein [Sphaerisporangium rubeum]